jgi:hypothetical protein
MKKQLLLVLSLIVKIIAATDNEDYGCCFVVFQLCFSVQFYSSLVQKKFSLYIQTVTVATKLFIVAIIITIPSHIILLDLYSYLLYIYIYIYITF